MLKKRFHPCGGFFLEGAMRWLVIANILQLVFGLVLLGQEVYMVWDDWLADKTRNQVRYYTRIGFWSGYILHMSIALPMDIFLRRSSLTKNTLRLRIWTVINFFNTLYVFINYWMHTYYFVIHIKSLALFNAYCIYRFYACVVVYYYVLELEEDKELEAASRALTEAELNEFEDGLNAPGELDIATKTLIEKVQYLKYKRDEFEISMDRLKIDFQSPLGNGAYGVVYRGTYTTKNGEELDIAVKTVEPGLMNALCFKALLSELKVMTYLGHHDHVLSLIGAVTSDIKFRRLNIIVEFCPLGNLLNNLRASRGLYYNAVNNGEIAWNKDNCEEDHLSTFDLIRWAYEIASGMEYLENLKVVHGDLAARNLLLMESKQIKIADFGLARQLYQYSVYVKRQNVWYFVEVPLPWRWLAIESITDMSFSSKSDVWAYGVVLHEIFTLGETPYQVQQFTLEFIESLRNGRRLEQPVFCPNSIYAFMGQCWHENPDNRPSFENLRKFFKTVADDINHKIHNGTSK